ncbi:MAG: glycosyltransferase [Flavobacteriales bacterium]|nr:glycosyltransferase [Flavobacteriales bacterium]|tara:strand:- start:39858 stop:40985 length:1128 start_codon:yes stop_codon:yes gene_type:complete
MRIAVNTRLLVPEKMDGIGRFTFETLQRICNNNPEVKFDFIFDRKPSSEFKFSENVRLISLSPPARHPILWVIWFEYRLRKYINSNHFDLLLSPEGWIPPNLNCPSLGVIHDLNFAHHPENIIFSHRKYLQYFFPKFANRANRIATVSEFSKKDIIETYNISPEKIDVVYNGANNIFKPISTEEKINVRATFSNEKPYFIFIGTLHPRKNIDHLLLAFDDFKSTVHSNVQLLIVGNRKWWPAKVESIYQKMKFKDNVHFLGRQSDENLAQLLASAEALTYLPYFEGFGIPILEAFQCEVPVITSAVSSMPEVAKDAALLAQPTDVRSISEKMRLIIENDELKKRLILKGVERAKDFSWDKTADLLWQSILKTLGK